ncbi:MAG: McrC family protein [Gemmataceae bacterium]
MQPAADALERELKFFEYDTCSDPIQGAKLYDRRECLQPYLTKTRSWITHSFDGERLCLRASHFVGILPFLDGDHKHLLMIAPKGCRQDPDLGLLYFLQLIALGNGEPPPEKLLGGQGQLGAERFLLFLAHHYAGLLQELCRRDFRSYYRPEEDELRSRIRGRLHLPAYARLAVRGKPHVLPCRWDEFTVDNWDNRILWAAARRLKKVAGALDPQAAAWVWQLFEGLLPWFSAVAEVPITAHDFRKSRLGRTSRYYRSALAWAELLIRGSDLPVAGGRVPPLVLDANSAFEKFAEVVARATLPEANWHADFQQDSTFLTGEQNQSHRPDILLSDHNGIRGVGDAKYKEVLEQAGANAALATGEEVLRGIQSADWNQLYVYMRMKGTSFGFFIVPFWNTKGDSIAWFDQFQFVVPPSDGNVKVRLAVLALNLLRPLTEVKQAAVNQLRDWLSA